MATIASTFAAIGDLIVEKSRGLKLTAGMLHKEWYLTLI